MMVVVIMNVKTIRSDLQLKPFFKILVIFMCMKTKTVQCEKAVMKNYVHRGK